MNVHLKIIVCAYCDRRAVATVVVAAPTAVSREQIHRHYAFRTSVHLPELVEELRHVEDRCLAHLAGPGALSADARREAAARAKLRA